LSPLDRLLATIEAEANEERARLDAESRAEAEAILGRAREEARAAREEILRSGEPEILAESDRRRAGARLEASRLLREAREESFELLLSETSAELAALRESDRYPAVLRALLEEGLGLLPGARALRVDPRDETLSAGLARELGADLSLETAPAALGGLVLDGGDGRTLRNTLEERLQNAEPELRLWYGRRLDELATGAVAEAR
jgi:V/A-type H+/Na+-transporting ATPase subunit E